MMNFALIRREDYYYVDKTRFIPLIEQADRFFFLIRPRRFGKSLTLNLLQHYYDVRTKDRFDALFGDLYIGKHPTPSRNSYLVLYLNFSGITGELNNYRKGLDEHCQICFDFFCEVYAEYLPEGIKERLDEKDGAVNQFDFLFHECERAGQKMYLFIDEYDHFTNAILSDSESLRRYTDETHGEGYLRAFFNKVKAGTYSSIERCFITGVSPVTMDDLTSGFNIGTNYSLSPLFNEMIGFTEEEVREMLTYYSTTSHFNHSVDELIEIMKPWYDNYCFAQECYGETTMYNSNMVLYFVKNYIQRGEVPRSMIESNIRIDYEKLRMLIRKDKEFAHDASIIQTLVSQGFITGDLKDGFPAVSITNPDNFVSLLYYFGMVTISGTYEGKTKLTIPNQVVREQIYTYLLSTYDEADLNFSSYEKNELASALAYRGDWQAYFGYIADCLKRYASQRDKQKGEFFVHGFTLAMTAQNRFYRPISEQDTQAGYVDIFLRPMLEIYSDMKHSYIVELKYAKYKDSENRVEELRREAIAQANRYADTETVRNAVGTTELHKIVVVYKGMEMQVCEEVLS
ncbi:AAA family ATPase [Parabacteroides sp.]